MSLMHCLVVLAIKFQQVILHNLVYFVVYEKRSDYKMNCIFIIKCSVTVTVFGMGPLRRLLSTLKASERE